MYDIEFRHIAARCLYVVIVTSARLEENKENAMVFGYGEGNEFITRREAFSAARRSAEGAKFMAREAKLLVGDNLGSLLLSEWSTILQEEKEDT